MPGESLWSADGQYRLALQRDGNLVLYKGNYYSGFTPKWWTGTNGTTARKLLLQGDGNLVLYANTPTGYSWASGTWGTDASLLALRGDGELALYGPSGKRWAKNTPPRLSTTQSAVADNRDRSDFHLLWRGRQDAPPAPVDKEKVIANLIIGAVESWETKALVDSLGYATLSYLYMAYQAVTTILQIVDFVKEAQGGSVAFMERFSGYCANTWETYAKVRIGHSGLSQSADLIWESTSRAETQYIRDIFQRYLKRQPTCDEMRGDLARMGQAPNAPLGTTWNTGKAQALLRFRVCESLNPATGKPWAFELATSSEIPDLYRFCMYEKYYPIHALFAYMAADQLTEWCPTSATAMPNRDIQRQRVQVSSLPVLLDDIKGAIGRPQNYDDLTKYKDGRLVHPKTAAAMFDTYFVGRPANEGLAAHWGQVINDRAARDLACARAGSFVQEVGGGLGALAESDRVLRDFFDLAADAPYGTDVVGQAIDAGNKGVHVDLNLWKSVVDVARTPSCGGESRQRAWNAGFNETVDNGYHCKPGEPGHTVITSLLGQLAPA